MQSSREQLAIAEFARALLVIPKTLAVNAAKDATDLVAKMRSYHHSSQSKPEHVNLKWFDAFYFSFKFSLLIFYFILFLAQDRS